MTSLTTLSSCYVELLVASSFGSLTVDHLWATVICETSVTSTCVHHLYCSWGATHMQQYAYVITVLKCNQDIPRPQLLIQKSLGTRNYSVDVRVACLPLLYMSSSSDISDCLPSGIGLPYHYTPLYIGVCEQQLCSSSFSHFNFRIPCSSGLYEKIRECPCPEACMYQDLKSVTLTWQYSWSRGWSSYTCRSWKVNSNGQRTSACFSYHYILFSYSVLNVRS